MEHSTASRMTVGLPHPGGPARSPTALGCVVFLFEVLLLFLLASPPAFAQDCISELTVIYGGSSNIQPPAGYTRINVDLNQGASGDYIYVCYKKGVGAPITGLAVTLGNDPPPPDAYYVRIDVDLNRGAGGEYIWLWYSKDPACSTIHDIHVQADTGAPPAGYQRIDVDLNRGAGGAFIYLSYREL